MPYQEALQEVACDCRLYPPHRYLPLPAGLSVKLGARQHRPDQREIQQQQAAAIAQEQRRQQLAEERRGRLPSRDARLSILQDEEEDVFWEDADPAPRSSSAPAATRLGGPAQPRRSHRENVGRREAAFRTADQHDTAVSVACAGEQPRFREEERQVLVGLVQQRINEYAARPVHPCSGAGTVTLKVCRPGSVKFTYFCLPFCQSLCMVEARARFGVA